MSNLLEQASLVLIPSGYKQSVVYSEIPIDGSGDLTFARNSDSTRVNSLGLVEKVRTNFVLYSQAFDNGAWISYAQGTGVAPIVTANNATAPDGTQTADTVVFNTASGTTSNDISTLYQSPIIPNATYSASFYARVTSGTGQLVFRQAGGGQYTTANLTTTWQRFYSIETGNAPFELGIRRGLSNEPINGSVSVQLWGAQWEVSDFGPTAYIPTTSSAVSVGPYSNIPRLNYQNGGGGCPSLLLEAQRTNLFYPSEDFTNANWVASNLTITANDTISPDGYQNADKFVTTSTTFENQVRFGTFSITGSAGSAYTVSVFAKKGTADFLRIRNLFVQDGATSGNAWFNLSTGAVGTVQSSQTASIQNMGNGWYRCILTGVVGSSNNYNFVDIGFTNTDATNYPSTSVNGYVWGAQLEAGSFVSSYIPTLGTSVTRVADDYSRSLTSIASGTAYINIIDNVAQGNPGTHVFGPFAIVSSSLGIFLAKPNNQRLRLWTAAANNIFQTTEINLKLAITWDGTYVNVWQNGVQVVTNYSYAITNVNSMFSSANIETTNSIGQITLFDSILTNAQLAELTA